MTITKAELQDKYDALTAAYDALVQSQKDFKQKIITVAGAAAREHELCEVLEETFNEIGIEVPDTVVEVTEVRTYTLSGFEGFRLGFHDAGVGERELINGIEDAVEWNDLQPSDTKVTSATIVKV